MGGTATLATHHRSVGPAPLTSPTPTDIRLARAGNDPAREQVMAFLLSEATTMANARMWDSTRRWSDPADLAQECAAEVHRNLERLPVDATVTDLRAFLGRTLRSRMADAARRARRLSGESKLGPTEQRQAPQNTDGPVTRSDEIDRMHTLMARHLAPTDAHIVELVMQGSSWNEIGERVDLSVEAVRKRYYRARARLQEHWHERGAR